jgi:mannitol operon transcriptional antiterminator
VTILPLDSRQSQIARRLLDEPEVGSIEQLAEGLQLTHRIVRYNLPSVEAYLADRGVTVHRRRGVGIWIEGEPSAREQLRDELDAARGPAVLEATDRQGRVLLALLDAAPLPIRSEELEASLGVSRPTVRRDVRVAEVWLEQHRLHLRRLPGIGLAVRGSELEVRAGLLALVLERVPANALAARATDRGASAEPASAGIAKYVERLELPPVRRVLADELRDVEDGDPTMLSAVLSIAIVVDRTRSGHPARLGRGRLRSLLDHPVSDAARRITAAIGERLEVALAPPEAAAITESLLGLVELNTPVATPDAQVVELVDRLIEAAAARLHAALGDDDLLRANLTEHVRRLRVRLRYGLPVSNPLRDEVRRRYPDVYAVAADILGELGQVEGMGIPVEEVGFLTMYLAGSLERHRLQPKVRVTVVCPAGMATVWILVSRLLAEFPQVEVAQVFSKTAFEGASDMVPTDLMISTVPLEGFAGDVPAVVVNPLLLERDIRHLTRYLGLPASS